MMDETTQLNALQHSEKGLADYLDAFKRRKLLFTVVFSGILVTAILVTLLLPAVYKSSAIILIEQQEIPQDLVRSTVTTYADQRIQVISQRVMTTTNMKAIIDKYDLYVEERREEPMEVIFDEMRNDISLDMISADVIDPKTGRAAKATIAFSLSYENESPQLAQKVANEFVSLFLNENLKNRTEMAEEANEFLQDEVDRLGVRVNSLEEKLAGFKEQHSESLPEMNSLNREFMERQERELAEVKRQIRALEERRVYLKSELSQLPANLGTFSETGERIPGPRDRLKIVETRYLTLQSRYSAEHPDVISARKEIEALEKQAGVSGSRKELAIRLREQRTELAALREKYSDDHPDVKALQRQVESLQSGMDSAASTLADEIPGEEPDNPAYIQIRTDLEAAKTEIASLLEKEAEIRGKIRVYEQRLTSSPDVEREFRALLREYENALLKFKEVKAKQMEAQLAENLETEKKGERFTLIEPPLMPEEPDKPNRMALFMLGFVLSLGAGAGSVVVTDNLDRSIYGRKGVERVLGELPLSVIPYIETQAERNRRYLKYLLAVIAAVLLVVIGLYLVNEFYRPLDVLWFTGLRKAGLM